MNGPERRALAHLLGAEGAQDLIGFLTGTEHDARITRTAQDSRSSAELRLRRPAAKGGTPADTVPGTAPEDSAVARPAVGQRNVHERHLLEYVPQPLTPARPATPFAPARTLIVAGQGLGLEADDEAGPLPADAAVLQADLEGWTLTADGGKRHLAHDELELTAALGHVAPRHIRVLVDPGPSVGWLDRRSTPTALLRLHDAAFLAAKAAAGQLAAGGSYYAAVLRGTDEAGLPHPYAGLFTGLVKAMEVETELQGADCFALLTSTRRLAEAIAQLEQESQAQRALPAVAYADGRRAVPRAYPAPLGPAPRGQVLPDDAVILGAGASRGIGMAMLLALAERARPRIHVIGSNDLSAYPAEALHETEEAFRERRHRYLLAGAHDLRGRTIAQRNADLNRMAHAREVYANLQRLKQLCGEDRVHYHACDLMDGVAVTHTVQQVLAASSRLDLVLNLAGINRSAALTNKRLADFQATRDLKVMPYRHLKAALADHAPRWLNASSFAGLIGIRGETDYAAGNDFLNTAGAYERARHSFPETSIGWGLWGEAGRGTEASVDTLLESNGDLARMPTAEGIRHLLAELAAPVVAATPVFFGSFEQAALTRARPWITSLWTPSPAASPAPRFFIDEVTERTPGRLVAYRTLTLERDGYLEDHLIRGHPTIPGLVLTEIAAQAAAELVPGRVPVALEDVVFERFVRVYRGSARPERKKIVATLVRHDPDPAGESAVDISIISDLIAPNGTVLARDRPHARMRVLLRDSAQPRPRPDRLPVLAGAAQVSNPYQAGSPVTRFSGIFAATATIHTGASGSQAVIKLDGLRLSAWFKDALLPVITCDAVAQVAGLTARDGWIAVPVPRAIDRIDLYGGLSDHALAGEELTLSTTAPAVAGERVTAAWGAAATADGRLALRMLGMTGDIIGYVHQRTGEFRSLEEHRARTATAPPAIPAIDLPGECMEDEPAVRPQLIAYDPGNFVRPVERMAAVPLPCPLPRGQAPEGYFAGRTVLLLGDNRELTAAVAAALRGANAVVHTASDDGQLAALTATAADWDGIIDLNLTGTAAYQLGDNAWRQAITRTTRAVNLVYRRWRREPAADRHFFLAVSQQDGLFGRGPGTLAQPLAGAWTGLAKSLPVELPAIAGKALDLDTAEASTVAAAILAETGTWDAHEIGYREGCRYRLAMRLAPLELLLDHQPPVGLGDFVLVSGGGRGIGYVLARALAAAGAQVVVTGREPRSGGQPRLDDAAYAAWRRAQLTAAAGQPDRVRAVLRELRRADRTRELQRNLQQAADDHLPLDYRACDITDRSQVDALLASLDRAPTVLIHNAGIYRGTRFSAYDEAEVVATLAVKVTGFANLLAALTGNGAGGHPLRLVSCAGSMAGRYGGMVGHVAYAAANNAMTQLGLWAAAEFGLPVHTIGWPTWQGTGNIVNELGAAQYGSTMDPGQGTAHWLAELTAQVQPDQPQPHDGESVYYGRFGVVLRPGHLAAASWPARHRDAPRLETARRLLGDVRVFQEGQRYATRHRFTAGSEPHLAPGTALPVPVLLEYALAAGDWVRPEGLPRQHLTRITDLGVALSTLRLSADRELTLDVDANGQWNQDTWQVQVNVTVETPGGPTLAAALTLHYTASPPALAAAALTDPVPVAPHADAALWCTPHYPRSSLPYPALTAILQDARARSLDTATPGPRCAALPQPSRLTIQSVTPLPGCLQADTIHRTPAGYRATASAREVLSVDGISFPAGETDSGVPRRSRTGDPIGLS